MLVNNRFRDKIAEAFYDKTFTIKTRAHGKDAEGGATTTVAALGVEHKGNVQYSLNARTREAYGITAAVDLAITADKIVAVKIDDEIEYNGIKYIVDDFKPRDSHVLIICKKRG